MSNLVQKGRIVTGTVTIAQQVETGTAVTTIRRCIGSKEGRRVRMRDHDD